jgi:hypothetical protein
MVDGLRVWYPAGWFVFEEDGSFYSPVQLNLNADLASPVFAVSEVMPHDGDGVPQASPQELAEGAINGFPARTMGAVTPVTIGGYTWYRASLTDLVGFEGSSLGWIAAYADMSGVRIVLAVAPTGEWHQYEDIFELMFQSME